MWLLIQLLYDLDVGQTADSFSLLFFFMMCHSQLAALWMNEMYWDNKPSSAKFSVFFPSLLLPLLTEMIHSSSLSMTEARRTRWSHSGTERMRRAVSALWLWRLMFLSHATGLSQHMRIHTYPGTHKTWARTHASSSLARWKRKGLKTRTAKRDDGGLTKTASAVKERKNQFVWAN